MKNRFFIATLFAVTTATLVVAEEKNHPQEAVIDHSEHMDDEHRHQAVEHQSNHEEAHDDQHDEHGQLEEHDTEQNEQESDHDHRGHAETATDAKLSDAQRQMAGIKTLVAQQGTLSAAITAPGEVMLNAYRTTRVTPRTPSQVMKRYAHLGDHVKKGTPLVSLSSVEMAEAQGTLMAANAELRRVKKLGRKVVSEKRFVTAQIAYQQAYAKVSAYGMTKKQIESLVKMGDASRATGEFRLLSFQDGTVISDDFMVGERVEAGQVLMEISDESLLWVEARLTPEDAVHINLGAPARVRVGQRWFDGKVIQARHTLDESTRTLALHIEVANPNDSLHPGQFVTAVIEGSEKQQGIVVPLAAVLRAVDGDWQVFVEVAPGRFEPKEVEVLRTVGEQMLIDGIATGTTIVSKGAFFVQSEIAKSGFAVHNH